MEPRNRISLDDSVQDMIIKLCDGNPGALTVLCQALRHPLWLTCILRLDSMGIYGPDIWVIYADQCNHDIEQFMRAVFVKHVLGSPRMKVNPFETD